LQKEKEKFASQLQAKKKGLWEAREAQSGKRAHWGNTNRDRWNERTRKQFTLARITTPELWTKQKNPERIFFAGNGISQFMDPESPLSIGLQTAPWPPKFKPVSLPKYNGFRNSRQFLMRY
jgi:hypothetical protein